METRRDWSQIVIENFTQVDNDLFFIERALKRNEERSDTFLHMFFKTHDKCMSHSSIRITRRFHLYEKSLYMDRAINKTTIYFVTHCNFGPKRAFLSPRSLNVAFIATFSGAALGFQDLLKFPSVRTYLRR